MWGADGRSIHIFWERAAAGTGKTWRVGRFWGEELAGPNGGVLGETWSYGACAVAATARDMLVWNRSLRVGA